jgi:hypothetical protein
MSSTGDVLSEESVSEVEDVSEFAASLDSLLKTVFKTSRGFGRSRAPKPLLNLGFDFHE